MRLKVLVTGGAGFIGSAVVSLLLAAGHQPLVVDNLSSGRADYLPAGVQLHHVDILAPTLPALSAALKPEVIIHLAAQVSVVKSLADMSRDAQTNILGTLNVLRAAVFSGCRKLILASSAAVYGNPKRLPIAEDQLAAPLSPYGISKHTAERYLPLYRELHGLDFTILRLANVYGPRQELSAEAGVTTRFLHGLLGRERLLINGDGLQTRDFIFVRDVAWAMLLALSAGSGETINIGSGQALSILGLLAEMSEALGRQAEPIYLPARPGDISHSLLDCQKAKQVLGFSPRFSLFEGLAETAAWLQEATR